MNGKNDRHFFDGFANHVNIGVVPAFLLVNDGKPKRHPEFEWISFRKAITKHPESTVESDPKAGFDVRFRTYLSHA